VFQLPETLLQPGEHLYMTHLSMNPLLRKVAATGLGVEEGILSPSGSLMAEAGLRCSKRQE
jgi:hypothetical protein